MYIHCSVDAYVWRYSHPWMKTRRTGVSGYPPHSGVDLGEVRGHKAGAFIRIATFPTLENASSPMCHILGWLTCTDIGVDCNTSSMQVYAMHTLIMGRHSDCTLLHVYTPATYIFTYVQCALYTVNPAKPDTS